MLINGANLMKLLVFIGSESYLLQLELARQSLGVLLEYSSCLFKAALRGKSGLHRVECQVIPGGREPTESAAENKPPRLVNFNCGKGEMVR
ncbi:MAG: hypothetical protein ACI9D5_002559 [Candidatus Endobugula sp.]